MEFPSKRKLDENDLDSNKKSRINYFGVNHDQFDHIEDSELFSKSYYILRNGDCLIFYLNKFSYVKNFIDYYKIKMNNSDHCIDDDPFLKSSITNNFFKQYCIDFTFPTDFNLSSLDFITVLPPISSNINNEEKDGAFYERSSIQEILFTTLDGKLLLYSVSQTLLNSTSCITGRINLSSGELISDVKLLGNQWIFLTTNDKIWIGEKVPESIPIRFECLVYKESFFKSLINTSAKLVGYDLDKEYISEEESLYISEEEFKLKHEQEQMQNFTNNPFPKFPYSPLSYFSPFQMYNNKINTSLVNSNQEKLTSPSFPKFRKHFFLLTIPHSLLSSRSSPHSSYLLSFGNNLTIWKDLSGNMFKKLPLLPLLKKNKVKNFYNNNNKVSLAIYDVKYYSKDDSTDEVILLILTGSTSYPTSINSSSPISLWLNVIKVPLLLFDEEYSINKNSNIEILNQILISKSIVNYNRDNEYYYLNPRINLMTSSYRGYIHWINGEYNTLSVAHLDLYNWIKNSPKNYKKDLEQSLNSLEAYESTILASNITSLSSVSGIDGIIVFYFKSNLIAIVNPGITSLSTKDKDLKMKNNEYASIKEIILNMSNNIKEFSINSLIVSDKLKNILITWPDNFLIELINDVSLTIINRKIEGKNWGNKNNELQISYIDTILLEKIKYHENFLNLLEENDFSYYDNLSTNVKENHYKLLFSKFFISQIKDSNDKKLIKFLKDMFEIVLSNETDCSKKDFVQDLVYKGLTVFDLFFSSCSLILNRLLSFSYILMNSYVNLKKISDFNDEYLQFIPQNLGKVNVNEEIVNLETFSYFLKIFYNSMFVFNPSQNYNILSDNNIRFSLIFLLLKLNSLLKKLDSKNLKYDYSDFYLISNLLLKYNEDKIINKNSENNKIYENVDTNEINKEDVNLKSLIIEISKSFLELIEKDEKDELIKKIFSLSSDFLIFDGLTLCLQHNDTYFQSIEMLVCSNFKPENDKNLLIDSLLNYLINNKYDFFILKFGDYLIENDDKDGRLINYYVEFLKTHKNINKDILWLFFLKKNNYKENFSYLMKLSSSDDRSIDNNQIILSIAKLSSICTNDELNIDQLETKLSINNIKLELFNYFTILNYSNISNKINSDPLHFLFTFIKNNIQNKNLDFFFIFKYFLILIHLYDKLNHEFGQYNYIIEFWTYLLKVDFDNILSIYKKVEDKNPISTIDTTSSLFCCLYLNVVTNITDNNPNILNNDILFLNKKYFLNDIGQIDKVVYNLDDCLKKKNIGHSEFSKYIQTLTSRLYTSFS